MLILSVFYFSQNTVVLDPLKMKDFFTAIRQNELQVLSTQSNSQQPRYNSAIMRYSRDLKPHIQHMNTWSYSRVLILAVLAFVYAGAAAQSVDDIVNKHLQAMGGADRIANLKSIRLTTSTQIMGLELEGTTTILNGIGFRMETEAMGMKLVQAYDGKTGIAWITDPMSNQIKELPRQISNHLKPQMDLTGLYNYKSKGYKNVTLDGSDRVDDEDVYKLKIILSDSNTIVNYLSKSTYFIVKTVISAPFDGQTIETSVRQRDFKSYQGLFYPSIIETSAAQVPGGNTKSTVKAIEINIPVEESIFEMPKK